MRKNGLALLLCAMASVEFLDAAVPNRRNTKAGITEYAQTNREALERFAVSPMENPLEDTERDRWQAAYFPHRERHQKRLTQAMTSGKSTTAVLHGFDSITKGAAAIGTDCESG